MTPAIKEHAKPVKRKGPPKFQHLPAQRAKKLKREWIEKKKIKRRWKAQKRNEESSLGETSSLPIEATEESPTGSDSADDEVATMTPIKETSLAILNNRPQSDNNTIDHNNKSEAPSLPPHRLRSQKDRERGGLYARGGKSRQPNMRNKMENLLAKIQKTRPSTSN